MATEVQSLEHSTLIVPYEILNRTFRNAQKVLDREVAHTDAGNEKLKKLSSKVAKISDVKNEFDEIISKLEEFKQKASGTINQEVQRLSKCKDRLEYLKLQNNSKKSNLWKKNRLDRLLIDYCLRNGYYETAIKMTENSAVKAFVDLELFLVARDVENALSQKNSFLCLQWCHSNKSKLKKIQSTLEMNVRIQEFVELIKKEQRLDAVLYAQKYFPPGRIESSSVTEVQTGVMALLAFKPNTEISQYKQLFDDSRWFFLVDQFRKENLALHQLNSQSMLEIVLQCGLASMKTPHCFHEDEQSYNCPVCSRGFNELAKPLPFAHSSQSRLLCSISGECMNENNHPLMLPNGNVYGEVSIVRMASDNDNLVTCPKTQEVYSVLEAKKIYIM